MKILTQCDIILDLTDPGEKAFAIHLLEHEQDQLEYKYLGNETVSFTLRGEFDRTASDYLAEKTKKKENHCRFCLFKPFCKTYKNYMNNTSDGPDDWDPIGIGCY